MNFDPFVDIINKPNAQPGDYMGPDGLLMCGKCHSAKQKRGSGSLTGKILHIMCKCELEAQEREKREAEEKRIEELRVRCLPLDNLRRHTFSSASDARHIQIARRYVAEWSSMRESGSGLILWGNTGSGKSFTSHCIANALIDQGVSVGYVTAADLVSNIMDKDISRQEYKNTLCRTPLLIVDDIGAQRQTPFALEQLCSVIDARLENGKPMIATTNYALTEMQDTRDPALSRLFDRLLGACVPIRIVGESRRRIDGAARLEAARRLLAEKGTDQ